VTDRDASPVDLAAPPEPPRLETPASLETPTSPETQIDELRTLLDEAALYASDRAPAPGASAERT
jgi:hypothetical protein